MKDKKNNNIQEMQSLNSVRGENRKFIKQVSYEINYLGLLDEITKYVLIST